MNYNGHIAAVLFAVLCSIGFPAGLLFYAKKRWNKVSWRHVVAGALVFAVFQIFTRIPLLTWLQGQSWFVIYIASERVLMIFFLSFTAGLFEEVGRYLAFTLFRKRGFRAGEVFAYGVGHGGFESVMLVGINSIANLYAVLYLAFGWFADFVTGNPGIFGSLGNLAAVFQTHPPYLFAVGGLERVFAILLHMALSFVVAKGVYEKKIKMLFLAIGLHTAANFIAVSMPNIWLSEGFLLLVAIVSGWYIWKKNLGLKSGTTDEEAVL